MSAARKLASGLTTVAFALILATFSQWPTHDAPEHALVRLSWRLEPIRVEECRTLTDDELADVPAHMRRTEECVGEFVDYVLELAIDGREAHVDTIAPSGLRRDRPVYVLHEEAVERGRHRLDVTFSALVPAGYDSAEKPSTLAWSGDVTLEPADVALVTLGPDQQIVTVHEREP